MCILCKYKNILKLFLLNLFCTAYFLMLYKLYIYMLNCCVTIYYTHARAHTYTSLFRFDSRSKLLSELAITITRALRNRL